MSIIYPPYGYIREDVCAALSLLVYAGPEAPPLPDGLVELPFSNFKKTFFHPTDPNKSFSFYVKLYLDKRMLDTTGNAYIYTVFRGTATKWDYVQDFLLAFKQVPFYFRKDVVEFSKQLSDFIAHKYGYYHAVIAIGHSLGGGLAQALYALRIKNLSDAGFNACVTYDTPGMLPTVQTLISEGIITDNLSYVRNSPYLRAYVGFPNAINTCNTHLPKVLKVVNLPTYTDYLHVSYPNLTTFFLDFTLPQHSMERIYQQFARSYPKVENVTTWVDGLKNSFLYYLRYSNHPDYWDDFMGKCWDDNPALHKQFENELVFYEYFKSKILTVSLDSNFNLNAFTENSNEARFKQAVLNNDVLAAKTLLETRNIDLNVLNGTLKHTYLHMTLMLGHARIAFLLLGKKAHPELTNLIGNTPLHCAALNIDKPSMLLFIDTLKGLGVNVNARNDHGKTPLDLVREFHPEFTQKFAALVNDENNDQLSVRHHRVGFA